MTAFRDRLLLPRHPFELLALAVCFLGAAQNAVTGVFPTSMVSEAGRNASFVWAVLLAVGSLVTLVAPYLADPPSSLAIEQGGLWIVSATASVYAVAIFSYTSDWSIAGLFIGSFGASCAFRCFQIQVLFRKARRKVTE